MLLRIVVFLCLVILPLSAPAGAQSLSELGWLAGGWSTDDDGGQRTEEHWTPAAGDRMFGISRSFSINSLRSFEHLVIEQREDGIFYLARPDGRADAVEFKLTECSPGRALFENPAHDFPQNILYEKLDPATIRACVWAGDAVAEWTFHRVSVP